MKVFEGKYLFSFFLITCLFTNQVAAQGCSPCPCSNYACPPIVPWGSCIWAAGACCLSTIIGAPAPAPEP
uniref:CC domain-containing protein n=1 Tax=Meloidogyne hapla TaxID=6305 RepID=A0A1I8BAY4_MELHA